MEDRFFKNSPYAKQHPDHTSETYPCNATIKGEFCAGNIQIIKDKDGNIVRINLNLF